MEGSKKYIKRRKQNYYGSTKHFYRSLINKELDAEGFSMFKIKKLIDDKDSGKNDRIPISDEEPILAMPIDAINILFIDNISNEYYLKFTNRIMVQFFRNPRRRHYYTSENINDRGSNDFNFTAYIDLLTDKVELDIKGIIRNPLAIVYNGFWKFEKLANQLPFDYQPE